MGLSREAVAVWLAASCAEQDVPVRVTDARVLAKVVALLATPGRPRHRAERGPRPVAARGRQIRQTARTRAGSSARLPG